MTHLHSAAAKQQNNKIAVEKDRMRDLEKSQRETASLHTDLAASLRREENSQRETTSLRTDLAASLMREESVRNSYEHTIKAMKQEFEKKIEDTISMQAKSAAKIQQELHTKVLCRHVYFHFLSR